MKRIYIILALMVLLFAGAYVIYDNYLASEEETLMETSSSIEIAVKDVPAESTVDADSEKNDTESSTVVTVQKPESPSSTDSSEKEDESESSAESQTVSQEEGWQGPESNYLNAEGDLLNLSDNYGKGTLINIWASWCEPCRVEMPYFEEAYQTYGDDINFIMMDALESKPSETKEAAEAFFEEMALSMPIYFDHQMNNQYLFGATILPLTVILDDEGKVVEIVRGQVSPAKLNQMIEKIR